MNSNKWSWIFTSLSILLTVVYIILATGEDKTKPELSFFDTDIIYTPNMDKQLLYEGVAAADDRDGDITDRVIIEKIVQSADAKSVSVTYAVHDSSNNLAKKVRTFKQVTEKMKLFPEDISENNDGTALTETAVQEKKDTENHDPEVVSDEPESGTASKEKSNSAVSTEVQKTPEKEETADSQSQNGIDQEPVDTEAEEGAQAPVLELVSNEITTKAGVRPAWVDVIKTLQDDKDDYNTLYRNLILGGNYKDNESGDYDVTLKTIDSNGNESAVCKLKIHVKE